MVITLRLALALLASLVPYNNPVSFRFPRFFSIMVDDKSILLAGFGIILVTYLLLLLKKNPYVREIDSILIIIFFKILSIPLTLIILP